MRHFPTPIPRIYRVLALRRSGKLAPKETHGAVMSRFTPLLRLAVALVLLFALPCAGAQSAAAVTANLYRCIGPGGSVSYQAQACAPGSRLDRTLTYTPEPDSPAAIHLPTQRRTSTSPRRIPRAPRAVRAGNRVAARTPPPSARCHAAKQRRQAELERLGLSRTYRQLSQIDDRVRAVCHGF